MIKQKICPICNKEFYQTHGLQKYCSLICHNERINRHKRSYQKVCLTCGKNFSAFYSYSKYCSKKCAGISKSKKRLIKCVRCGKVIKISNYLKQRYCSIKCRRKDMGEGKIRKVQKKGSFDRIWSKIVRAKANYKCELCGVTKNNMTLNAHHIVGRRHLSTRHYIPNGICLCIVCHRFGKNSAHENPLWFYDRLVELRGIELIEHLKQKSQEICKWVDIKEKVAKYLYDEQKLLEGTINESNT